VPSARAAASTPLVRSASSPRSTVARATVVERVARARGLALETRRAGAMVVVVVVIVAVIVVVVVVVV
jgi:hypothetical protein